MFFFISAFSTLCAETLDPIQHGVVKLPGALRLGWLEYRIEFVIF